MTDYIIEESTPISYEEINPERILFYGRDDRPYFVDEQGYLRALNNWPNIPRNVRDKTNQKLIAVLRECGFSDYICSKQTKVGSVILDRYKGSLWEDCLAKFRKDRAAKQKAALIRKQDAEQFDALKNLFGGKVLHISKKISYRTDRDFFVRVGLSHFPYQEQLEFVRENKKEILSFLVRELRSNAALKSKIIGDLGFYEITSVTLTRSSELEVVFSIKEPIQPLITKKEFAVCV